MKAKDRPAGVTIIACLTACVSLFLLVSAVMVANGWAALSVGSWILNGLELRGPVAFLLTAAFAGATAIGLTKLQRWSRFAAIAIASWMIAAAVPGISSAVAIMWPLGIVRYGASIIAGIMAIRYLFDEPVREAFAPSQERGEMR